MDPKLESNGLPPYPNLPGHLDSRRIEEIRRTLMVANLDSSVSVDQLLEFFVANSVEIKYLRLCTRDSDTDHYALVELNEQSQVVNALLLNGKMLAEKPIKLYHSNQVRPLNIANIDHFHIPTICTYIPSYLNTDLRK